MTQSRAHAAQIQEQIDREIDDLLASFPKPEHLSAAQRRGIIARYTAVLEGNFIYWMTAPICPSGRKKPARSFWTTSTKKCATVIRG
jgi:hypothetical protein